MADFVPEYFREIRAKIFDCVEMCLADRMLLGKRYLEMLKEVREITEIVTSDPLPSAW